MAKHDFIRSMLLCLAAVPSIIFGVPLAAAIGAKAFSCGPGGMSCMLEFAVLFLIVMPVMLLIVTYYFVRTLFLRANHIGSVARLLAMVATISGIAFAWLLFSWGMMGVQRLEDLAPVSIALALLVASIVYLARAERAPPVVTDDFGWSRTRSR